MKRVERPGLDAVYLREGVSLAKYKKVMLDPVEVSFDKNWDPKKTSSLIVGNKPVRYPMHPQGTWRNLAHEVTKRRELERKNGVSAGRCKAGEDGWCACAQIVDLYINAPDTQDPG